jgi:hypothetical protein
MPVMVFPFFGGSHSANGSGRVEATKRNATGHCPDDEIVLARLPGANQVSIAGGGG